MMKKIIAIMTAVVLLCGVLTACGEGGSDKVADDLSVMGMSFTRPEGFTSAERTLDINADGTINEKNIVFSLEDGSKVTFAVSASLGLDIGDTIKESFSEDDYETREVQGLTFYIVNYGANTYALAQRGDDIYGVRYTSAGTGSDGDYAGYSEAFENAMNVIRFSNNTETAMNPEGMIDVSYTLSEELNIVRTYDTYEQSPEGEVISKSYTWSFGADDENIDMKFLVRVIRNTKLEDELAGLTLNDGETMPKKELNGLTYTARVDDDGAYQYYIRHGEDVYIFKNLAVGSGWYSSRSAESYAAFDTFMQSVRFK